MYLQDNEAACVAAYEVEYETYLDTTKIKDKKCHTHGSLFRTEDYDPILWRNVKNFATTLIGVSTLPFVWTPIKNTAVFVWDVSHQFSILPSKDSHW